MNDIKIESVEEFFRWRLSQNFLESYNLEKINHQSVEEANRKIAGLLEWPKELDVLYSFLLIYKLGLEATNNVRFMEIKKDMQREIAHLNTNSPNFLFKCSRDPVYQDFNKKINETEFLKVYFSIGNLIPIWPGGNECRGKSGIYDIPEIFFKNHPVWTNTLIDHYKTAYLDDVVNVTYPVDIETLKNDKEEYFKYIAHRRYVILKREEKVLGYLKNKQHTF